MIIGIDASKAGSKIKTGVENFVYELILHLKKIDKENVYFLYSNQPLPSEITDSIRFVERYSRVKYLWNSIFLPLTILKYPCDVYLQPTDEIPWSAPRKSVAIVHDLAYKYFPGAYSQYGKLRQYLGLKSASSKAIKIICPSNSTKKDFLKFWPSADDKTSVIPLGYDNQVFHPIASPHDILKIKEKYILYTGRIESRKNVLRLVKAYTHLKKEKNIPHKLVLAGSPGHNSEQIMLKIEQSDLFGSDIILPGHIDHAKLPEIIAGADLCVFPSLYEGFGLPVLEAMACGKAVVASKTSSLPEIAGDAAILCDPENEKDISAKIWQIISNPKLKKGLEKAAVTQAKKFSWKTTAEEVLKLLESL